MARLARIACVVLVETFARGMALALVMVSALVMANAPVTMPLRERTAPNVDLGFM